jgi:NAD-dependent DNA ligase
MATDIVLELTQKIAEAIKYEGDIKDSDPEIWEHLFAETVLEDLKKFKPAGRSEETEVLRGLYIETRKVLDQALIPSDLFEAHQVIKYQISPLFLAIAKKNNTVGSEILNDLKSVYLAYEDEDIQSFAKKLTRKVEKALSPQAAQAETLLSSQFNQATQSVLTGRTVAFTGTLATMTRKEAVEQATSLGIHVADSVTKNTDFLVAGADAGSKLKKAATFGIPVLSETQWNDLIEGTGPWKHITKASEPPKPA